ncbi:hypothetical protein AOLI_G00081350 [Acnodon oligacanthus]
MESHRRRSEKRLQEGRRASGAFAPSPDPMSKYRYWVFSFLITDQPLAWTLRLVDKESVGPIRVPLISKAHFVATLTMSTGTLRATLFSYLALRPPSTAVNAK